MTAFLLADLHPGGVAASRGPRYPPRLGLECRPGARRAPGDRGHCLHGPHQDRCGDCERRRTAVFSGMKHSRVGRESGNKALRFFTTEAKNACIELSGRVRPWEHRPCAGAGRELPARVVGKEALYRNKSPPIASCSSRTTPRRARVQQSLRQLARGEPRWRSAPPMARGISRP